MTEFVEKPRVIFVTNFCPHYRVRTFEMLARELPLKFYFYSAGGERYWQQQHGTRKGDFVHEYLDGFSVGDTRVTPSLAWKLWRENCDVFVKCINGKFALPLAYVLARLRHKPFILWSGVWHDIETPVQRLIAPLTKYLYRHADAVVTYGEHVKDYLVGKGVDPARIFSSHHAVDNDLYSRPVPRERIEELRSQLNIPAESPVVLYLGRMEESKGLDYLLKAFAALQHPAAVLLFVGEGAYKQHLRELAQQMGVAERVRFSPYVRPEDTPPYYALSWSAVLPSITTPQFREPWGLTVNEAMNQGVPVIATDAVGAAAGGLVRDGVTGLVVPERNVDALAAALARMLDEPLLRQRLGARSRQVIRAWDNHLMVQDFRAAIDYVLRERAGQHRSAQTSYAQGGRE